MRILVNGGLVVPPGDAISLANAIGSLAVDRTLCRKMGDGARAIALALWDKRTILSMEQLRAALDQRAGIQASTILPDISVAQRAAP
jgi:hypothetical protein